MENKKYDQDNTNYENFEIDRAVFGAFVAAQRKEKGYTQKELADRLFVSDKAVSKWERGLSLPDISLLVPLADVLGVTVMELLQGRRLEPDTKLKLDFGEVELLVKKAVTFSVESAEEKRIRQKKNSPIFFKLMAVSMAEVLICVLILFVAFKNGRNPLYINCITPFATMELIGVTFGIHFWLFMEERLPAYYDENKISTYTSGMFNMHLPGVYFNNTNWKTITKALKKWNAAVLVGIPFSCMVMSLFITSWGVGLAFSIMVLVAAMIGLFVPVYVAGREKKGE